MTLLLNGQAVKVAFGSTSVTCSLGSSCLSARAQVAPAKPPPTTTMRAAACENTGIGRNAAEAAPRLPARNWRRVARCFGITCFLSIRLRLRLQPGGDRLHFFRRVSLRDAIHDGGWPGAGAKLHHRADDLGGVSPVERRYRALHPRSHGVAAGTGRRSGRLIC